MESRPSYSCSARKGNTVADSLSKKSNYAVKTSMQPILLADSDSDDDSVEKYLYKRDTELSYEDRRKLRKENSSNALPRIKDPHDLVDLPCAYDYDGWLKPSMNDIHFNTKGPSSNNWYAFNANVDLKEDEIFRDCEFLTRFHSSAPNEPVPIIARNYESEYYRGKLTDADRKAAEEIDKLRELIDPSIRFDPTKSDIMGLNAFSIPNKITELNFSILHSMPSQSGPHVAAFARDVKVHSIYLYAKDIEKNRPKPDFEEVLQFLTSLPPRPINKLEGFAKGKLIFNF